MSDETPAGFFIGNIFRQTSLQEFQAEAAFSTGTNNPKMRATLLDTTRGLASRLLHLNDMGDLYTINTIDRDDVLGICGPLDCCSHPQCNLTFTAVFLNIESSDELIKAAVILQLIDSNDNPPTFQDQEYSIAIPEITSNDLASGQSVCAEYSLPSASDKDSVVNGVKEYLLDGHPDYFTLTSPEHECYPCLKVSGVVPLDYENPKHRRFTFKLIAIDGGATPMSSFTTICVFLTDLNDNPPVFSQTSEVIRVKENHTYNHPIYTVRATDADSGSNGLVQYQLKTTHSMDKNRKFTLNFKTGELFIQSALDYEKYSERKVALEIFAFDNGRPSLTSTFSLTIVVIDMNDNPPEIVVQQNHTVMENGRVNIPALQLLITDADEVSQGKIKCFLENQERLPLRLEGHTFLTVWTNQQLDYEKTPLIYFDLICMDKADPPTNTTKALAIKVGNQNDNPPIFYSPQKTPTSVIELTIREDERILRPIYLPTVIDADGNEVNFVMKSVEQDCPFTVKPDTGAIYLKTPLDYENYKQHEFEIVAVDIPDKGSEDSPLSSSIKVRVKVQDVNDNPPELKSPSIIPVKPETPPGYLVSQLHFKDPDGDGQQEVTTKLISQKTYPIAKGKVYFALKENGALITLSPLDRDIVVIELIVLATDIDPGIRLSSTFTVAIVIENPGGAETLRIARPFPASTMTFSIKKIPNRPLKPESLRGISIPLEIYDSMMSTNLAISIDRQCNGSEYFQIDKNQTTIIKPILTDAILNKLSSIPSGSKLEIVIKVIDSKASTRMAESTFFVEFDWAPRFPVHALWPADAADSDGDNQNDLRGDDNWYSSTENVPLGDHSDGKQFKLSIGNIVMFLLILVFTLAVGFALFAAILWARAKRATSNAAAAAAIARRSRSPIATTSVGSEKLLRSSPKESSIWQSSEMNYCDSIRLTSTHSQTLPEVHYAILTSSGNGMVQNLSKASEASGNSGGPVLAYLDLVVPSSNERQTSIQTNYPDLSSTAVSVAPAISDNSTTLTQPVNCYLVM